MFRAGPAGRARRAGKGVCSVCAGGGWRLFTHPKTIITDPSRSPCLAPNRCEMCQGSVLSCCRDRLLPTLVRTRPWRPQAAPPSRRPSFLSMDGVVSRPLACRTYTRPKDEVLNIRELHGHKSSAGQTQTCQAPKSVPPERFIFLYKVLLITHMQYRTAYFAHAEPRNYHRARANPIPRRPNSTLCTIRRKAVEHLYILTQNNYHSYDSKPNNKDEMSLTKQTQQGSKSL
jgi:hypothetical protein